MQEKNKNLDQLVKTNSVDQLMHCQTSIKIMSNNSDLKRFSTINNASQLDNSRIVSGNGTRKISFTN